jgi:hypothetical protein
MFSRRPATNKLFYRPDVIAQSRFHCVRAPERFMDFKLSHYAGADKDLLKPESPRVEAIPAFLVRVICRMNP